MELLKQTRSAAIADERWVAALFSCTLNLAVCWFLLQSPTSERYAADVPSHFIEVIFVDRAIDQIEEPPTPLVRTSNTVGRRSKGQRQPISEPSAGPPPTVEAGAGVPNSMPLNLHVPKVPIQFADHNPLERSTGQTLPVGPQLHVRFVDRSLGGALQRMSRSGACRHLRTALANQPASAESILKTMQRYGCGG